MPKSGEDRIICPFCHSAETRSNGLASQSTRISTLVSIMLLGIPFVYHKKTYHCFDCGNEFRSK